MALKSINPYTNEVIEEFESLSDEQIEEKIQKSADAFIEWKYSTFE